MWKLPAFFLVLGSTSVLAQDVPPHTIAVSGFGSVETLPDRASVVLSIVARQLTVAAAQKEAAEVTARVLKLTEELDIPDNRVDTMSATVSPEYQWNPDTRRQEFLGYIAQRQMRIELHDLEKVGAVIERSVAAGVNQVTPPQLSSSRERDAYREALARAAEDARKNAEQLASTLGLKLGPAIRVDAGSNVRPPVPMMRAPAMEASVAAEETYRAGDLTVDATVSVVFETSDR